MLRVQSPRLRYTLRGLFVFVTLFCVWGGYHANRGWRERQAEAILIRHGAELEYGPFESESSLATLTPSVYSKLVWHLWRDRPVLGVTLKRSLEPDTVEAIMGLANAKLINLYGPSMKVAPSSRAIERILEKHQLISVTINDFLLPDTAFAKLSKEGTLEVLDVSRTNLSDQHLTRLIVLPRLQRLTIESCRNISGRGLDSVPGSKTLQFISGNRSPIGIEFADFVARSPAVEGLIVSVPPENCPEFLTTLGPHPSLEFLWGLSEINDQCIPTLEQMPSLRHLTLTRGLSKEGRNRLARNRPDLRINSESP